MRKTIALTFLLLGACTPEGRGGGAFNEDLAGGATAYDGAGPAGGDLAMNHHGDPGCGELQGCYTVYAHSDTVLYHVDLKNKLLVTIGKFNAPMVTDNTGKMVPDTMTDLAVGPDDRIWTISHSYLYTADKNDGHVTLVTPVSACGKFAVALTFAPDGTLYAGDYGGAFCKIDTSVKPAKVIQITASLGNGLALAGDIVSVADGTMYGTAQLVADGSSGATALDNYLVKMNPVTGQATIIGQTGYPKMFGIAYAMGQVFGFTHDTSGDVALINPKTGKGTLYGTFKDPTTNKGISFAGAGVNSMVAPTIM